MNWMDLAKEFIRNPSMPVFSILLIALIYAVPLGTMVYVFQDSSNRIESAVLKLANRVDTLTERISRKF